MDESLIFNFNENENKKITDIEFEIDYIFNILIQSKETDVIKKKLLKLIELIKINPVITYNKLIKDFNKYFYEVIKNLYKNINIDIRNIIETLLKHFFELSLKRDIKNIITEKIYLLIIQNSNGLRVEKDLNIIHGILCLLKAISYKRDFFILKYKEILEFIYNLTKIKNDIIQEKIIENISHFCKLNIEVFLTNFFVKFYEYLKTEFNNNKNRKIKDLILKCFGELSLIIENKDFIKNIVEIIGKDMKNTINISSIECMSNLIKIHSKIFFENILLDKILLNIFKNGFSKAHQNFMENLLNLYINNSNNENREYIQIILISLNIISIIISKIKFPLKNASVKYKEDNYNFSLTKSKSEPIKSKKKCNNNLKNKNEYSLNLIIENYETFRNQIRKELFIYMNDLENNIFKSNEINKIKIIDELTEMKINALNFLKKLDQPFFNKDILYFYQKYCLNLIYYDKYEKIYQKENNSNIINYQEKEIENNKKILIAIINLLQSKWIPNYIDNINNPKNINFEFNDNNILENILDTFLNFILMINDNNFNIQKSNTNKIKINNNEISTNIDKNSKYKNINNNYIILLILKNLSNKFDILFTKESFFLKLILLLNIPEIHIKEQCVIILSRILAYNYTSTFLYLQKNIIEIFFILDTSENMDLKELNIELLKYYIKYCGKYITNYLEIIFYKLIQIFFNNYEKEKSNLNSNNIIIVENDNYVNKNFYHNIIILNIIKEIINYGNINLNSNSKNDLNEIIVKIINICNEYLKEASISESKEIILSLLLTIFENSSNDYHIYFKHLELVKNLINILEKTSNLNVRIIALKIFGFIGTMNPDKYEALIDIHNKNENNEDYNDDEYENFDDEEIVIHNREQMKEKRKKNVANYFNNYYNNNKKIISKKKVEFEKLIYLKEINLSYYTTIKCLFNKLIDENLENRDNQIINIINQIIKYFYDNKNEDKILIEFILKKYLEILKKFSGIKLNNILESISNIIKNFKNNCINYLNDIINLIEKYIYDYINNNKIFDILLNVINEYNNYIDIYLNRIIKILVKLLQDCNNKKNIQNIPSLINSTIHNVCECLNKLTPKLNNYLNIIVPEIIIILNHYMVFNIEINENNESFENNEIYENSEEEIFKFISNIIPLYNFNEVMPNIVIILIKYINFKPSIYKKIMDIFIKILKKDNNEFISYLTPILKVLSKNNININEYLITIKNLIDNNKEKNNTIEKMKKYYERKNNYNYNKIYINKNNESLYYQSKFNFNKNKKNIISYYNNNKKNIYQSKSNNSYNFIIEEFNPTKCTIEEDWHEWFKSTSKQLFYYSPSSIINYCTDLSETLSKKLYNHAFFSIWNIFNQNQKDKILYYLINALNSQTISNEVLLMILNLFEFLEREDNNLNLFKINKVLAISSEKCNAFAKQLYYTEKNYIINNKDDETIEKLINLYYEVNLPESSMGLLEVDKDKKSNEENWYIKLHKYDKALEIIDNKIINNKNNIKLIKNKIICLEGLSDWESLLKISESDVIDYNKNKEKDNQELYKKFALASFNLNDWEKLDKFMGLYINNNNEDKNNENIINNSDTNLNINNDEEEEYETNFLYSVLNIHQKNYKKAQNYIDTARKCIIDKIKNLLSENYERAYKLLLKNEHLYELEEIIKLNTNPNNSNIDNYNEQKKLLKKRWDERLDLISEDTETYERILAIRGLIFSFEEKYDMHLELAKICREDDHFVKCMNVLERINKIDTDNKNIKISIALSLNKCLNENDTKNDSKKAIENLKKIIEVELDKDKENKINSKLKSKVYFYYGYLYFKEKDKELNEVNVRNILSYFQLSIKFNDKYYKAWHYYSLVNYKFFEILNISNNNKKNEYAINALKGFTNSIIIGGNSIFKTLQDILRLIDIWFQNDNNNEIFLNSLNDSFKRIPIDPWLQVIPQLLARVNVKNNLIKKNLIQLLKKIGCNHPWSLIYPLIVMNKSEIKIREEISSEILTEMRQKYNTLINECTTIIDELNRSALLLHEKCQEAIEEAAKAYFEKNDLEGMIHILRNFSENLNKYKPITVNEKHFYQKYKSALREAYNYIKDYEIYKDNNYIKLSWDIYQSVFINISNEYKSNYLNLDNISPLLANFTQSEVSMPGVYRSDYTIIKITGFNKNLLILNSKQHPRKITMYGSDGKDYIFLLKGHEDLRQDERAMQLFALINTFFRIDVDTSDKFLAIKRFPVIALSNNTGLLGWVPNCDTLSILIKEYRLSYKIPLDLEQRQIFNYNSNYESSCMLNKYEIFKNALATTDGNDIYKILWKFSKNSEKWLDRRTNYSRSLAVMSMVGYILGLGDRHPSNLMIDRKSGKIMHIDFGDCFEVAMRREKFPEKVPFRLTRMMVNALEVSCIEGTFKFTCMNVMRILRNNKDSLIAILSAFIHDPLISFRFLIPLLLKSNKGNANYNYISKSSKMNSYKSFTNNYLLKSLNNNFFSSLKNNNFINNNINNQKIKRNYMKRNSNIYRANTLKENNVINFKKNNKNLKNNNFEIQIEQLKHEKILMGSAERQLYNEFTEKEQIESEELNKIAKIVLERIIDKLKGTDFNKNLTLDYKSQVDKLIQQATNDENLCQMYFGWCSYW